MTAKEAIKTAKQAFLELFADEKINDLGLEEIEHDAASSLWNVTVGFHRLLAPSNDPFGISFPTERFYKVVSLNDTTGEVISVKSRSVAPV